MKQIHWPLNLNSDWLTLSLVGKSLKAYKWNNYLNNLNWYTNWYDLTDHIIILNLFAIFIKELKQLLNVSFDNFKVIIANLHILRK